MSPYVRTLLNMDPRVHIYFCTDLKMGARKAMFLFKDQLNKLGLSFLITDFASPFFIISGGMKAKEIWKKFPIKDDFIFNRKKLSDITWEDIGSPDTNTSLMFQIWDINDIDESFYDLFIIDNIICRPSLPIYHPA